MECNKKVALIAIEIAQRKLHDSDFMGAKKMAQTAQRLYPELENINQLLAVIEVCSLSENKISGLDYDWYEILQIQQTADEEAIRKQYRKLAFLLHPDKNKFVRAEEAFKLINEGHRLLTDHMQRTFYDMKLRVLQNADPYKISTKRPTKEHNEASSSSQNISQSQCGDTNEPELQYFWTICASCGVRFLHRKTYVNRLLRCKICDGAFIALGNQNVPHGSSVGHNPEQNIPSDQASSKVSSDEREEANDTVKTGKTSEIGSGLKEEQHKKFVNVGTKGSNEGETSRSEEVKPKRHEVSDDELKKRKRKVVVDCDTNSTERQKNNLIDVPEPEFSDFDKQKSENLFDANQIWVVYDENEAMPRFYCMVRKVLFPGFKLKITWLEPNPFNEEERDWCNAQLPVGCGKFKLGESQDTSDILMFSHLKHNIQRIGRGSYFIYPCKGETWALFKDWDSRWSSDPASHVPCKYEIVEVLSNFDEDAGVEVAYLCKVIGFVSLFQRSKVSGDHSFKLSRNELYRFSHQVPSHVMTGEERDGVPKGSFELDTAGLPFEFFEDDTACDVKLENDTAF